jgi:hypothetical protein
MVKTSEDEDEDEDDWETRPGGAIDREGCP